MLNISHQTVRPDVDSPELEHLNRAQARRSGRILLRLMSAMFLLAILFSFLPWTQNVRGPGVVTALQPNQRPQDLHSVIAGRIEKWFVQEGDYVEAGDTIMFISDIKDEYFDPRLLERMESQVGAKEMTKQSYLEKVSALNDQIQALEAGLELKIQQAQNKLRQAKLKVASDSIDYEAYITNHRIAELQFTRMKNLYDQGLKSLTDLEKRELNLQKTLAAKIAGENKLLTSRNDVLNAQVELGAIQAKFQDDIAKAKSAKYTALSSKYDTEASITKLQNQFANYQRRTDLYFVTAPQDGYITRAIRTGIGETVKEGEQILTIMPADYDLAIEMYVRPIDLPLLAKDREVRIQFDGWPAIVFSGWPNASQGTYGGKIFAIDQFISKKGMYRVLVVPDENQEPWPSAIRIGSATECLALLDDVPIWYELWRQFNGFPPNYYQDDQPIKSPSEKK